MAELSFPESMEFVAHTALTSTSYKGKNIDIVSAYEANGQYLVGQISSQERREIISCACPGPGACGGMYTANTSMYQIWNAFFGEISR